MFERCLRSETIIAVTVSNLTAPSQRSGELPARRDLVGIQRACRPALLVNSGFELFGIYEMAPTALKRERPGRIPGHTDRRRVQWPRLDIPTMLVRLAAVEATDLQLHAIKHNSSSQHAEADV